MGKRRSELVCLSQQLRHIIRDCGLSRYKLGQLSQVDASQLFRFIHGTGRLTNDSMDRLGAVLRLRLVVDETEEG